MPSKPLVPTTVEKMCAGRIDSDAEIDLERTERRSNPASDLTV